MATEDRNEDQRRWSGQLSRRWGLLADDVQRRLGPGSGLEPGTRAAFEGRLGGDLSGTIVHRSPLAGHLARSLGAAALSTGEHVLGDDQLDGSTPSGAGLLAHELAHVAQRDVAGSGEAEAQVIERAVAAAAPGPAAAAGGAPAGGVDAEAVAERVYQRLMDQLRLERERAAWIA